MDQSSLDFLTSQAGESLLVRLADSDLSDANILSLVMALRREYAPDQVNAAVTQARLRQKAVTKFGEDAHSMFFTEDALQQASDPRVRAYRASCMDDPCIIDAGCGIGADTLAFAYAGKRVSALDIDPVRVALAQHNLRGWDQVRCEVADVRDGLPTGYDTVFFDPARRDALGKRIYDVEAYIPPLAIINTWSKARIAVKLSPGIDLSQLAGYSGGVEFISVDGDLKEAVLWCGFGREMTIATLLRGDAVHQWRRDSEPNVAITEPRDWLVEPDPALIRAGLVQDVAETFDGTMLDTTIAYFTTDNMIQSPWVRCWRILDWMPFHLKRLRAYLRERDVGQVTVKKRGSPLTPEALIGKLKLKGSQVRTLVLTRCREQPVVLICEG